MKRELQFIWLLMALLPQQVAAQKGQSKATNLSSTLWSVVVQARVLYGVGTISSFLTNNIHLDWAAQLASTLNIKNK